MKKTMFITSVIMVVVLAIALTTSSLAWFTAGGSTSVGTNVMQIAAHDAEVIGAGLQIATVDTDANFTANKVGLEAEDGYNATGLYPLCPVGVDDRSFTGDPLVIENELTSASFYAAVNNMYSAKTVKEQNIEVFKGAPTPQSTAGYKPFKDTLYLRNTGIANNADDRSKDAVVQFSVQWPTNASRDPQGTDTEKSDDAMLWVAIFDVTDKDEQQHVTPVLVCLANNKAPTTRLTYAGADTVENALAKLAEGQQASAIAGPNGILIDEIASSNPTVAAQYYTTDAQGVRTITVPSSRVFEVYAWFDGASLVQENALTKDSFTITVTIVPQP